MVLWCAGCGLSIMSLMLSKQHAVFRGKMLRYYGMLLNLQGDEQ